MLSPYRCRTSLGLTCQPPADRPPGPAPPTRGLGAGGCGEAGAGDRGDQLPAHGHPVDAPVRRGGVKPGMAVVRGGGEGRRERGTGKGEVGGGKKRGPNTMKLGNPKEP